MILPRQYTLPLLWVVLFSAFLLTRLSNAYTDKSFHTVLSSRFEHSIPAGEVVTGFHLKQPIDWNLLYKDALSQDDSNAVCVSVLLANYNNRKNDGSFSLSLQVDSHRHRTVVDAKTVLDNAYRRICYDNLLLRDVANKSAAIIVEGIDSRPGRAITTWMTKDAIHGGAVLNNRTLPDRSLTFRIDTKRSDGKKRIHAIILTIICGMSGTLLFSIHRHT